MRGLKDRFIEDLQTGKLVWFLEELKKNPELYLSINKNFITYYYKGNNILEVKAGGGYNFIIQEKYFASPELKEEYAIFNRDKKAAGVYQRKFPVLVQALDESYASVCCEQDSHRQILATNSPQILTLDYDIPASYGGGTVDMIGVFDGKLVALSHNLGQNLATVSTTYQNLEKMWSSTAERERLLGSVNAISANLVTLGLADKAVEVTDTESLTYVALLTDCDTGLDLGTQFAGTLPMKALFLTTGDSTIDLSKAKDK